MPLSGLFFKTASFYGEETELRQVHTAHMEWPVYKPLFHGMELTLWVQRCISPSTFDSWESSVIALTWSPSFLAPSPVALETITHL